KSETRNPKSEIECGTGGRRPLAVQPRFGFGGPMLDVAALRQQFPALHRVVNGRTPLFLDGPGGTQVPWRVLDAITHYLTTCNANHGGVFTTGRESDAILHN